MDPVQQDQNPLNHPESQTVSSDTQSQDSASTLPSQSQESILTPQPQTPTEPSKSSKKFKIVAIALVILFLLSLVGISGFTYALAYKKIKLNNYPELQKKVAFIVQSIRFMPKTPEFLLAKSALAHQEITKQSFDISLALDSQNISSALGLNKIDIQAKGAIDYSDPNKVNGYLDLFLTKDLNVELRKKDAILYFKINKLPSLLLALLSVEATQLDSITNVWVSYDTTPLDTPARKSIQDREIEPLSEDFLQENFEKYFDDTVLSKMTLTDAVDGEFDVYKITLDADPQLINYLGKKLEPASSLQNRSIPSDILGIKAEKLSDIVKKLQWEIYIDKKEFFTRKIVVLSEIEVDETRYTSLFLGTSSTLEGPSKTSVAFAAKFGNFGQDVIIQIPEDPMNFDEFTSLLSDTFGEIYSDIIKESQIPNFK